MLKNEETLQSELNRLQSRLAEINREREHIGKEIERIQNKLEGISSAKIHHFFNSAAYDIII